MSIGIVVNLLSVFIGGLLGVWLGKYIPTRIKNEITWMFGLGSLAIGIQSVIGMKNMPIVVISIIVGTALGMIFHLGDCIEKGAIWLQKTISHFIKNTSDLTEDAYIRTLVMMIVLFCASGTGIYGTLVEGMTQDPTILISKSVLDFFTAAIFASQLGIVVSTIAIPQGVIFFSLFILAKYIMPFMSPSMIADFKACGGLLVIATSFRMMKMKDFPIADMVLAMPLVIPFSWFWTTYILPFLG